VIKTKNNLLPACPTCPVKRLPREISVALISLGRSLFNRDEILVAFISSGRLIKKINQFYSLFKL